MKDKRVEDAQLKFHNILVILQFLVELAMHGGHWNESSLCKKNKKWHTCLNLELLDLPLFEAGNNHIGWLIFQSMPKLNHKKWSLKYTTPFNFKKFYKVEFEFGIQWNYNNWFCNAIYFLDIIFIFLNKKFENGTLKKEW